MPKSDTDARTDAACTTAGIYRSDCADQERVTLAVGDGFPKCPSCRKAVGWNLSWRHETQLAVDRNQGGSLGIPHRRERAHPVAPWGQVSERPAFPQQVPS